MNCESMTQFPSQVYRKVEEAGQFFLGTPNPGNPRPPNREDATLASRRLRVGRELGAVFTLGSGLRETNLHQPGLSALLRSEHVPRPMTSHGFPGWWYPLVPRWGGGQGKGWGCRPAPG